MYPVSLIKISMARYIFLLFIFVYACRESPTTGVRNFSDIPVSMVFSTAQRTGTVQGRFVKELSGIAASRSTPGAYWVHEDGKKITEIYLIDSLGNRLTTCLLTGVKATQDCEDIAIGPGPEPGVTYIYLADTGDNNAVYETHTIYRFPEPVWTEGSTTINAADIVKLVFEYPEHQCLNSEGLLLDPVTRDLFILTKSAEKSIVFKFSYPQNDSGTTTLEHITDLPIYKVTAGDISPNGAEVLLKSKREIYYWRAQPGESIGDLLTQTEPQRVPYAPEIQGEAVCFNLGATGFFTSTELAEAAEQPVYYFPKK